MVFSPNGKLLAAGSYGASVMVWATDTGSPIKALDGGREGGLTPVFSPDGRILAVGNRNSTTRLFDVVSGKLRHVLPESMTQGLSFDPKGERLAVAYVDGRIGLWSIADGRLLSMQQTTATEIYRVRWSPAGDVLVSAGLQGNITLWNPDDLSVLREITAPEWVIEAKFSPDGTRLVTSGGTRSNSERRVEIWGVLVRDWVLGHAGL